VGLESPSFVNDFVTTNPDGSDARSQGDDHIRNMKSALRATLPNADRAFYFPTATTKTADFVVASTDMNKTFFVDVTSPSTSLIVTLPTLTASSDGWFCTFIKTTQDAKPLMIFPASGTLQSGFVRECRALEGLLRASRSGRCGAGDCGSLSAVSRTRSVLI